MPLFRMYSATNMGNLSTWDGAVQSMSSSSVVVSNGTYTAAYYGNFRYSGGELSGGTVTGFKHLMGSSLQYEITSLSVDVNTVLSYLNANDGQGLAQFVLSGGDLIYGSNANDTIYGYAGNDTLRDNGGNDRVYGGDGADIFVSGAGRDTLYGGAGGDYYNITDTQDVIVEAAGQPGDWVKSTATYTLGANLEILSLQGSAAINGTGNAQGNLLSGNSAANTLYGLAGNDIITANGGNDRLVGSIGNDRLTGGTGNDLFYFNSALNGSTNVDTIIDFSKVSGNRDLIYLDDDIFTALGSTTGIKNLLGSQFWAGTVAHDANDRIIYDQTTGALYYDADGNGRGAQVQIAIVGQSTHPALTYADFRVIA